MRAICVREIQKTLKQSAKFLLEKKIEQYGLGEKDGFKVFASVIETPGDGVIDFTGMQDHTAESVKSYEGFHRAWIEEGQTISATSLSLLRPTIRWEDTNKGMASEIWATWNPRRKIDPIDMMLRGPALPSDAIVVQANWRDNPWFPSVLEQERQDCLRITPEQYNHIWEGGYATVLEGAYFAQHIQTARNDGRIGVVTEDPLMQQRIFVDIGGTGAKADAFALWNAQFVGKQVRVLKYYEQIGQPLASHLAWLRQNDLGPERATIYLPHDGSTNDRVYDVSYESAFKAAGYEVIVIPNQGKGAATARIEAARRMFPGCWFHEESCEGGLDALGWYHERKDENRNIGLGPEHDWASHGADAFGLMAICYQKHDHDDKPIDDPYKDWQDYSTV